MTDAEKSSPRRPRFFVIGREIFDREAPGGTDRFALFYESDGAAWAHRIADALNRGVIQDA